MDYTDSEYQDSDTVSYMSGDDVARDQIVSILTLETIQSWKESLSLKADHQLIKTIAKYAQAIIEPLYSTETHEITDSIELQQSDTNLPAFFDVVFVQLPISLTSTFHQSKKETIQKPSNWNSSLSSTMKTLLELCILIVSRASLISWQYDFLTKNALEHYHSYFLLFPKLLKTLLQHLAIRWSECPPVPESKGKYHKKHDLRSNLLAFVHLNRIAQLPTKRLFVMKCIYEAFGKSCPDHLVSYQIEHITFMIQSMIELFQSCPSQLLYEHGSLSLKTLMAPIIKALHEPKLDHFSAIATWSFILKIAFWSRLIVTRASDESIRPLFYPLIQIMLCATQLTHAITIFFPFHIHIYSILIYLMQSCDSMYIPVEDKLIQILQQVNTEGKKSNKALKPVAFTSVVRIEQAYEHTQIYHQNVIDQIFKLLGLLLEMMQKRTCFADWIEIMIHRLSQLKCKSSPFLTRHIDEWLNKAKIDSIKDTHSISNDNKNLLTINERFYLAFQ